MVLKLGRGHQPEKSRLFFQPIVHEPDPGLPVQPDYCILRKLDGTMLDSQTDKFYMQKFFLQEVKNLLCACHSENLPVTDSIYRIHDKIQTDQKKAVKL